MLLSPVVLFLGLLNLAVLTICTICKARPKSLAIALCSLAVIVYGTVIGNGIHEVRRLSALKEKYDFESLDARLAYEKNTVSNQPETALSQTVPNFSYSVLENLNNQEGNTSSGYWREWSLRMLHEQTTLQFALAAGFGVGRMSYVSTEVVELEPLPVIKLPLTISRLTNPPVPSELETTHLAATLDFIATDRMGYIRNRNAVAGFGSHGFSNVERWAGGRDRNQPEQTKLHVIRLELVSLLRHAEPLVYVSTALPLMDELEEVPTRPLDAFEQGALQKLRFDQDTVTDIKKDRIRMLGAVRAGNYCLQCHEGQRGELLGAFSYELVTSRGPKSDSATTDDYLMSEVQHFP